ncbi:Polycomb group protein [Seminavis robusta]|uniref:Polycomb group protein n=1 Tax=Seminavis robusta TaxID=568900 RepID=A0A9N8ESN4_9STRA|nr:Polycomb group protein [Seminavis robusta]|eukprot:Sro1483_g276350.1 Polycomb group protein (235) ;mRNA; r:2233-2937
MKVSKTTSVREEHGCNIYSIAFSQDILVEELNNRNKCYYRTFCSCAGPYVTVYKIQVFDLIDGDVFTGPSGPMLVHQSYVDVHPEEEFWACAFGGRSFLPTKPTKLPAFKKQQSNAKEEKPKKRKEQGSMVECEEEADTSMHEEFLSSNDDDDEPLRINLDQQPTGPHSLAAGKNRTIQVIDTTQQKLWMSLQGHGDEINCLKFHPIDNNILASASNDKSVRLWNLRNGTKLPF